MIGTFNNLQVPTDISESSQRCTVYTQMGAGRQLEFLHFLYLPSEVAYLYVAEALCYKLKGRYFKSWWDQWIFQFT
jgi:hypothetical protein